MSLQLSFTCDQSAHYTYVRLKKRMFVRLNKPTRISTTPQRWAVLHRCVSVSLNAPKQRHFTQPTWNDWSVLQNYQVDGTVQRTRGTPCQGWNAFICLLSRHKRLADQKPSLKHSMLLFLWIQKQGQKCLLWSRNTDELKPNAERNQDVTAFHSGGNDH